MKAVFLKKYSIILTLFLFGVVSVASAQSDVVINPTGGTNTTDGLRVVVKTNGYFDVYQYGFKQIFGSGFISLYFRFNNNNSSKANFVYCSNTPLVGDGSVASPWSTTVTGKVTSPVSGKIFYVTYTVKYSRGNAIYVDYIVRAPYSLTTPEVVHMYLSEDTYIGNDDAGMGFMKTTATGHIVGDYRVDATCRQNSNSNTTFEVAHAYKVSGSFDSYYSDYYGSRDGLQSGSTYLLTNSINPNCYTTSSSSYQDNGIAVHVNMGTLSQGQAVGRQVMIGYGITTTDFDDIVITDPSPSMSGSQPVKVEFVSASSSGWEGDVTATAQGIKVRVSEGILTESQTIGITKTGGTAVENTDYTYQNAFIIPAGDYTVPKEIDVNSFTIKGNNQIQNDRTITMRLEGDDCNDLIGIGPQSTATYTIKDDDCNKYSISVAPNPVDAGAAATVTVSLDAGVTVASGVTMNVVLSRDASSTAVAGTHYTATLPTTLTFNSSYTSRTFNIATLSTASTSSSLKLVATPTAISGSSCTPTAKNVTLQIVKRVITLEVVGSTSIDEGGGTATGTTKIRAYIDSPAASAINIPIAFTGTAVRGTGNDYTTVPTGNVLTISSGGQEAFITITALADDLIELGGDETVVVTASPVGIYAINPAGNPATINIVDKTDGTIVVEKFTPTTGDAKENPLTHGSFKIKYAANANTKCTKPVKITYELSGSAVHSDDYTVPHLTETIIDALANFKEVPVTVKNNYIVQGEHDVVIRITYATPQ